MKKQNTVLDFIEKLAKDLQLWYMKNPEGSERINDGALYFHPKDCREEVLAKYGKKIKN